MARLFAFLFLSLFVETAAAQSAAPADSRLKSIISSGTIKVAYRADARPFSFVRDKGEPTGFSIDICKLVAGSIKRQFGVNNLRIEWVPVTTDTRLSAVASGKADMECGATTVTLGRMKEVDFSNFIYMETTGLVVRKMSNVNALSQVKGKRVAVISGTTNERVLLDQIKQQRLDAAITAVRNRDEAAALLESGRVDAFASDKLLLIGMNLSNPNALEMLPDDLSVEPYAIVLPRGDWALRLAVNTGLAEIYRDGRVANLFKAWFEVAGLQLSPVMRVMYGLGALAD